MKKLMLGNEAVARGAYEAGVRFVSSYPGTPSTEITESIVQYKDDIFAEWAPNEKVACEAASGAAMAGARAMTCCKHVGLNVMADPVFTMSYIGANGGLVIAVLCIITVLGDFERVSKVFRLLVPVLFVTGIVTIILTIRMDFGQSGAVSGYEPGRMSPNWPVSALVFMAYNTLGMITMAGRCAVNARDSKNAYSGAVLGTLCLGGLTILLLRALLTDMAFSASLDLPMLGFSARISSVLNVIYAVVLYGAVYSTGATTYYGFSTRLRNSSYKKYIIAGGAAAGFLLGLTGFKRLVEFLYPAQGYIGILFIVLIIINFVRQLRSE